LEAFVFWFPLKPKLGSKKGEIIMAKRKESKKTIAKMKHRTIHNSVHLSTLLVVLCAGFTAISVFFGLMRSTVMAQGPETEFWYSDARWALVVILELDETAQSAAMAVVDASNSRIGEDVLSIDENSRAFIVFHNRSNGRWPTAADLWIEGEVYGATLMLFVHDEESPLCVSLLALPINTFEVEGRTEVKINSGTPTSVKFKREIVTSVGVIGVKGRWVRSVPETIPPDGVSDHFDGVTYYRIFAISPGTLRLLSFRRTAYDIVDALTTDPSNEINLKVNFTHPVYDYQAIFGGSIVRAFEYFGELQLETIIGASGCDE